MTAAGEDILAWLERAIATTEETARRAPRGKWTGTQDDFYSYQWHIASSTGTAVAGAGYEGGGVYTEEAAKHITLNDPVSVLRRCAADRKLLELHGGRGHSCPAYDYDGDLDEWTRFYNHEVCPVVQNLAEGYGWTDTTDSRRTQGAQTPPTEGDQMT